MSCRFLPSPRLRSGLRSVHVFLGTNYEFLVWFELLLVSCLSCCNFLFELLHVLQVPALSQTTLWAQISPFFGSDQSNFRVGQSISVLGANYEFLATFSCSQHLVDRHFDQVSGQIFYSKPTALSRPNPTVLSRP